MAKQLRRDLAPRMRARKYGTRDLATEYGVTTRTIERWREVGILPPPIIINGYSYWTDDDLDELERSRRATSVVQREHTSTIA
jgi:hypothetical protein